MADSISENISDKKYGVIRRAVQLAALFGYRLEIEGRRTLTDNIDELREGVIFVGNHESVIDAFLMGLVVPAEMKEKRIYFLGKQSALWKNRFWGTMMDYFGVIPVQKRGNQEAIRRGIGVLQHNQALGIFPEGHIRYSRKELEGKVGVARFAFETDSPVVPVGIIGTDGILPYGGNWPTPGKKVTLKVGNPIFLHNYDNDHLLGFHISVLHNGNFCKWECYNRDHVLNLLLVQHIHYNQVYFYSKNESTLQNFFDNVNT